MKRLKKADIIKLRQVDHVISENSILADIDHPFLVRECASPSNCTAPTARFSATHLFEFSRDSNICNDRWDSKASLQIADTCTF